MKTNKKKGFTLIELLVVIAIVGLLATLAMVALKNAREKGRDTRRKGDLKQVYTALDLYLSGPGAGLYPVQASFACFSSSSLINIVSSGLMVAIPNDPLSSQGWCYQYRSTANGSGFKITGQLESDTLLMQNDGGNNNNKYEIYTPDGQSL